ncbi:hypothetical protein D3C87_1456950 [compost metagenome]
MCLHGCNWVPAHFRPRRIVGFEMVGVEFDEPRNEVVALEIQATCAGRTDVGDDAAGHFHGALHDPVGQDDAGIGEHGLVKADGGHVASPRASPWPIPYSRSVTGKRHRR